ncbi:DNA polymerase III subunit gamma and tau [Yimella sp. cx-51]|uniref:DNA polymerase III subunit gamma and tau n=1 Tax=Yimella sp. cx-51 TaxID=2770551 RepID=UPI00165D4C20|nr:DNA polymerase III subunit gamma and tau [Yimella sp. cx-51]MBC9956496.1 DNA polymerase III subunit gamma and tau [Yimella sp. cx-51]QTH38395.1 DNA polymerase III subunit gamma and tau [Yimella sp. cx-51]
MSTALYRRYRPETFADVIGQEHVTEPLMQALRTGRVNHAYLFSGPRGCGKTTSARILARCLNCEQGPTPTPCGTCDSCVALSRKGAGTVDVIEIDAASHGGVDDARDLRERASYGPAQSRFKIYIIDEAHMVTPQGFNALLKIVEEPPEHVKFIFATTEPEKVIGTIRSRTHHYPFRLVPPARLAEYMQQLCATENVAVEPGVLSFVTRAGGGSVRDSLSVLDQLIAGSDDVGLTYAGAASLLGFTDSALLDATVDALAAGDGAAVFTQIDRVVESGHDPRRFVEDLLERLRDLIIVAAVPDGAEAVLRGLPADQVERMRSQAGVFGANGLSHAADIINAGLTEMTGATSPRLQLELMCARVLLPRASGEQGYGARLDRLERRMEIAGSASAASSPIAAPEAPTTAPAPAAPVASTEQPAPHAQTRPEPEPAVYRPSVEAPASSEHASAGPQTPPADHETTGEPDARERSTAQAPTPSSPHVQPPTSVQQADADADAPDTAGPAGHAASDATPQVAPSAPRDEPVAATTSAPSAGGMSLGVDELRREWPNILQRIAGIRRVTWTLISQHAHVASFDGSLLVLGSSSPGLVERIGSDPNPNIVRRAVHEALGLDVRVQARVVGADGALEQSSAQSEQSSSGWGPSTDAAVADPGEDEAAKQAAIRSRWQQRVQQAGGQPPTQQAQRPETERPASPPAVPAAAAQSVDSSALDAQAALSRVQREDNSGDWSTSDAAAPAWATAPAAPSSPSFVEPPAVEGPDDTPVESMDDEDVEDGAAVGLPVMSEVLGAVVIEDVRE